MARSPAPPVSTSVPSISNSTRFCIVTTSTLRGPVGSAARPALRLASVSPDLQSREGGYMKLWHVLLVAGSAALAGAVTLAQTAPPPPKEQAPAKSSAPAARAAAHADIKGEGITGTADFAERAQGSGGSLVEVTVTVNGIKPGQHGI